MKNESELVDSVRVYVDDYVDESKESRMAVKYLKDAGLQVKCRMPLPTQREDLWQTLESFLETNLVSFANSRKEPLYPCLWVPSTWIGPMIVDGIVYLSFSGVKSFLREFILDKKVGKREHHLMGTLISDQQKIKTFYPRENLNLVSCFDKQGRIIFEGEIGKAPHKLLAPLSEHNYPYWHDVGSWEIGSLDELCRKRDNSGVIVDRKTATVLFDDDVERLKNGETIPFLDSRCYMEVIYASYYNDNGIVYRLYANMLD